MPLSGDNSMMHHDIHSPDIIQPTLCGCWQNKCIPERMDNLDLSHYFSFDENNINTNRLLPRQTVNPITKFNEYV